MNEAGRSPDVDIQALKSLLLRDGKLGLRELRQLHTQNPERFLFVIRELIRDESDIVTANALKMLGYLGTVDDPESEALALDALYSNSAVLKDPAFLALGSVGTSRAFPILLSFAASGSAIALEASAKQARTDEQKQEVLQVARTQIFSNSTRMIYIALSVLRKFSTPQRETDLLLAVLREYPSDIILHTLRYADPSILPILETMRATFHEGTVQYQEVTDTINILRKKQDDLINANE